MLSEMKPWVKDRNHDFETSSIEFLVRDFYGPVVVFRLERYGDGKPIKAFPIEHRCESVEVSMDDGEVFGRALDELTEKFGNIEIVRS